jgi:pimeloyl-ACP methyl ester carboxylesterase
MPQFTSPNGELHYELSGQGPPILLIQGVGCIGETWRPQVRDLESDHQVLIFDNRGIGRSQPCPGTISIEAMAADALALMERVGWSSAHVAGHSMGGLIAQQLALDAPQRVRSLCLQCTFSRGREAARLTPWIIWKNLRIRIGTRAARRRAFLELVMPPEKLRSGDTTALAKEMAALVGRDIADQPPILMKQVMAMSRHDVSARLHELTRIPTLVLSAEHDPIARPEYGQRLATLIPGARYEILSGASHAVTIHDAPLINDRMRVFLHAAETRWQHDNRDAHPGSEVDLPHASG